MNIIATHIGILGHIIRNKSRFFWGKKVLFLKISA